MDARRCSRRLLPLLAAALVWPCSVAAQFDEPPPPAARALRAVTIVRADGSTLAGVDIVIRDGLIEAMGPGIAIPADARILEGDSLFVYPGLVDAVGEARLELPEVEIDRAQVEPWNPPREVQGFTPHLRVIDHLTASGSDVADRRKEGIVAAAVHPTGRLMPGRGAVLLHRKDAAKPVGLVVRPALGPVMTFRGAQGVYPSTLFGVIAFYRQMFEDARHWAEAERAYARDPRGRTRPAYDPDLSVVLDVLEGRERVFFAADLARDIQRVLSLARDYGFQPVIVGGEEAWKVADELRAADVPVLVSLDFPEPERWKPEEKAAEEADPGPASGTNGAQAEDSRSIDAAALREKERLENIYSNAGRLEEAGVRFALTSNGGKARLLEGARKAVEYGLSEGAALRALSATPAAVLGIDEIVRLETGLPATFVVTDGPLFAEETKVRYTFVEGGLEEAGGSARGDGEPPAVEVTGTWDMSIDAEGEQIAAKLILEQDGAAVTGTMQTPFGEARVTEGNVSGSSISLTIQMTMGQETMNIEVSGTVEGDEASGDGESPMGSFKWTARRAAGPEKETGR